VRVTGLFHAIKETEPLLRSVSGCPGRSGSVGRLPKREEKTMQILVIALRGKCGSIGGKPLVSGASDEEKIEDQIATRASAR